MIPLPPRPLVEQYRKLAKDLVKACAAGDPAAIGDWAERWLESLRRARGEALTERVRRGLDRAISDVEAFAIKTLTAGTRKCALTDAQFVLARSHGFDSWPKLVAHIEALAHAGTETSDFEAAADAIVSGDEATLERLLRANPGLIHARSTREHRATLLHYVAANGVEGYRQKTPKNIVRIARILLESGAEIDAEADLYGGGSTTLGLVATSAHPRAARVQIPLLELLLDHGARIEHENLAGNDHTAVLACLANGCPEAARYLAERGARLSLVEAAGVGRLDVVRSFLGEGGKPAPDAAEDEVRRAFFHACAGGSREVVAFFLGRGLPLDVQDGAGQTPLHHAVMGGNLETVELLIERGAPLEVRNMYGGTVLGQTLWCAGHGGDPDAYVAIIERLLAAGAQLAPQHPQVNERVDALLARHGSVADPTRYWFGEAPRKRRS